MTILFGNCMRCGQANALFGYHARCEARDILRAIHDSKKSQINDLTIISESNNSARNDGE